MPKLERPYGRVFALLEQAAARGHRCPTNPQLAVQLRLDGIHAAAGSMAAVVTELARQGRLSVRVYAHNFRTITVHSGPHAGKTTMLPPEGWQIQFVIDKDHPNRTRRRRPT